MPPPQKGLTLTRVWHPSLYMPVVSYLKAAGHQALLSGSQPSASCSRQSQGSQLAEVTPSPQEYSLPGGLEAWPLKERREISKPSEAKVKGGTLLPVRCGQEN